MIKLVFGSKNKIIKLEKPTFQSLNSLIQQSFTDIPVDYSLSYLDTDKDEICLNSDQDLHIMLNSGIKINKIYIKQSLSQAIQITDRIEPSFQIYEHKVQEKEAADNTKVLQQKQEIIQQIAPQVESEKVVQVKVQDTKVVIEEKRQQKQVQQKKEIVSVDKKEQVSESVSKLYVLNVSDTNNKIQLQENALNEKIFQYVTKIITNKQKESKIKEVEQKKEVVVEKQQVKQEKVEVTQEKVKKEEVKPQKQDKQLQKQQQQKKDKQQRPFLKKEHMPELIYHNVICAQCNDEYGIIGIRYQCILCERYDLCSICEQKVEHQHSLLKVKIPKQAVSKEQIINRFRKQILASKEELPNNHYVPSISRDEAKTYLQAGKKMMAQSFEKTQNLMNDFFLKLQMSHKNPYQVNKPKPIPPKKQETIRQKIDYLIDFLGITDREATAFCHKHYGFTKQQLLNIYVEKRANKLI